MTTASQRLRDSQLPARKSLGQHFLLDPQLLDAIARDGGPVADRVVYEVGPGPGGLTQALLEQAAAHVIAVETDARWLDALGALERSFSGRLTVTHADALTVSVADLPAPPTRIVSNLPYNVGTALLVKWLTCPRVASTVESITVMVQREVARRIAASHETPSDYGRLSVLAQTRAEVRLGRVVAPEAFTPPPAVHSQLVRLTPKPWPTDSNRIAALAKVTAAAFGMRRKMLRSSLKQLFGANTAIVLGDLGIDATARAENVTLDQYDALASAWLAA